MEGQLQIKEEQTGLKPGPLQMHEYKLPPGLSWHGLRNKHWLLSDHNIDSQWRANYFKK